jgi:hypothetical protein
MGKRGKSLEPEEVHRITIEFSAECSRKTLDKLLTRVGRLLCSTGVSNVYVKDDYTVDYVLLDEINGDNSVGEE